MPEDWRPVPGWTQYEISECGVVRNIRTGRVLSGYQPKPYRKRGRNLATYKVVELHCGRAYGFDGPRTSQMLKVHVLVCSAFHGVRPSPQHQAAHWDGNHVNNHFRNLRWATRKENADDRFRHGRYAHGLENKAAKLTEAEVVQIYLTDGPAWAIGARFGCCAQTVRNIKNRSTWKDTTSALLKPE